MSTVRSRILSQGLKTLREFLTIAKVGGGGTSPVDCGGILVEGVVPLEVEVELEIETEETNYLEVVTSVIEIDGVVEGDISFEGETTLEGVIEGVIDDCII